ncbi:MAG TPA: PPC domain-containing protein [Gemmataceae bacterium]|nr:PPC domain-containing protein [Gemmataceae bacterium]
MKSWASLALLFSALSAFSAVKCFAADPAKPDAKDQPKIVVAVPLGLPPGKPTKLVLRGLKLDEATEVRVHDPKGTARILGKRKTPLANKEKDDLPRYGDTQVEVEVTLSADWAGASVPFTVVTPAGESPPHLVLIDHEPVLPEKEPNNGFRNAQPVTVGQTIEGVVNPDADVDVYRFDGKEGQQIVLEVLAARHGSPLDSMLTLYDADGRIVAANDDCDGSPDSRIEATLPRTGTYFVALVDADDIGSTANVYRLTIRAK